MGNIEAGNGSATVDITDDYVELFGEYDVDGRSFVVCTAYLLNFAKVSMVDLHSKILGGPHGPIWQNNRLAPFPLGVGAPSSGKSWIEQCIFVYE